MAPDTGREFELRQPKFLSLLTDLVVVEVSHAS